MTSSVCAKYIGHLKKVIPKAIELKGDATGYFVLELQFVKQFYYFLLPSYTST